MFRAIRFGFGATVFFAVSVMLGVGVGCARKPVAAGGATDGSGRLISWEDAERIVAKRFPAKTYMTNAYLSGPVATLPQLRRVKVGMAWIINDEFAPIYIALDQRIFERYNLQIELVPGGPGRDHLLTLIGGQIDFAIAADGMNLPTLVASPTGGEVLGVGAFLKRNPVVFIGLDKNTPPDQASHRVIRPEDFIGTKVGVVRGRQHYLDYIVEQSKLPKNRIEIVWTGATPDALLAGSVDYWAAWAMNQPRLVEQSGYRNWTQFSLADYGWDQYCDVVVVRRAMAEREPELVRAFMAALQEATAVYLADPQAAVEATMRQAKGAGLDATMVARRFELERSYVVGDDGLPPLHMDPTKWNRLGAFLVKYGLVE